jgi:uroporphyrinogen III methyltransferase / synthase
VTKRLATEPGTVVFIGAGPGDPGLLTTAALRALRESDVILLQRPGIVPDDVLPDGVPVLEQHGPTAATAVIEAATSGKRVGRVLVGDPLVDSYGAEEAAACQRAGVPFEIVPGVPLATAVPAYAGVAVGRGDSPVSVSVDGTQVLHGARAEVAAAAKSLLADGADPATAVVVIADGTTPAQTTTTSTLGALAESSDGDDLLVVVVDTYGSAAETPLGWFETRPLFGWRVLVPRTKDQAGPLVDRLAGTAPWPTRCRRSRSSPPQPQPDRARAAGAGRGPLRVDRLHLGQRAEGGPHPVGGVRPGRARHVGGEGRGRRRQDRRRAAARGASRPSCCPAASSPRAGCWRTGRPTTRRRPDEPGLPARADIATETLAAGLAELGWEAEDVTAYRTVRAAPPPAPIREAIKAGAFDAVLFTSSSDGAQPRRHRRQAAPDDGRGLHRSPDGQDCRGARHARGRACPDPVGRGLADALAVRRRVGPS